MIDLDSISTYSSPKQHSYGVDRIGHYYGDIVRKLFMAIGLVMLFGLTYFADYVPQPISFSVAIIIITIMMAGLFTPLNKWIWLFNIVFSAIAVFVFQSYAIEYYQSVDSVWFFLANQGLAVVALFALYFSVKTLRGFYIKFGPPLGVGASEVRKRPLTSVWLKRGER